MMEIDRLAADLHKLRDRSVTELRKCVIIVAGLSTDYEIEVCKLENNPTGLDRTAIEHVVGNEYNRLLRQKQNSKALLASKDITTADRGEKKRRPRNRFEGNCFNYGRKGHRAYDCRSAKISKNQVMPRPTRRAEIGTSAMSVGVRSTLRIKHCGFCRNLEHRTRDCEERGAEEGAMLAEVNVPANAEVGLVAVTAGTACGDDKRNGIRFRCVISYVPYTSRDDCLQKGVCGDDCRGR